MAKRRKDSRPAATRATSATKGRNEWGIPDWRDPVAYSDVKRWTFNRWRWEFYRRRDDLREYFDAQAEETFRHWQQYAGQPGFPTAHLRPDEHGFCAIVDVEARKRFGYSGLPNPRIGEQPANVIRPWETDSTIRYRKGNAAGHNGFRGTFGELLAEFEVTLTDEQAFLLAHSLDCFPIKLAQHEITVTFDLNKPLQAQLETARDLLKLHQSNLHGKPLQKRRHPERWLAYLRALDADADDATLQEIADLFYAQGILDRRKNPSGGYCAPPPQAARDMLKAANDLRFNF